MPGPDDCVVSQDAPPTFLRDSSPAAADELHGEEGAAVGQPGERVVVRLLGESAQQRLAQQPVDHLARTEHEHDDQGQLDGHDGQHPGAPPVLPGDLQVASATTSMATLATVVATVTRASARSDGPSPRRAPVMAV